MNSALTPAGVFIMFGVFSVIAVVFVWKCVLESKHLSDKDKKSLYSPKDMVDLTPNMARRDSKQKHKSVPVEDELYESASFANPGAGGLSYD